MTREIDRRDFSSKQITEARCKEFVLRANETPAEALGGHRVRITRFDPLSGKPAQIVSDLAPAESGNYVQRAQQHARLISSTLEPGQVFEFRADPHIQEASSGAIAVHLQQQYKGILIFQAALVVRFTPNGSISEMVGNSCSMPQDVNSSARISVIQAVHKAAEHVAAPSEDEYGQRDQFGEPFNPESLDISTFQPQIIAIFSNAPDQPSVLEGSPFGEPIKARLMWFPLQDELRLVWEVILTMPKFAGQYRTLVDAQNGEILYCHQLVRSIAARGNVYRVDGASAREWTDFPRPITEYGLPFPKDLPPIFPDDWVSDSATLGNCTKAHLNDNGSVLMGTNQNDMMYFNSEPELGDAHKVLNLFYYNCYMHDFFYLLGFREANGNFQFDNFGRGGLASDRVDARAYTNPVWGTASMVTLADGRSPVMNMGLVQSTNRHTAFDSSVVFHEFTHGVTHRLVGGGVNDQALDAPQSSGMGEGWSDYISCTVNNSTVVGSWVMNNPRGIRGFPYDANFPDNFSNLGSARYTEIHNIGEIWCATLLEINRKIGKWLALQLIFDALKLTPANPSFLEGRDAIFAALDARLLAGQISAAEQIELRTEMWKVFARFGMGPRAQSNGASLSGVVPDFHPPEEQPRSPGQETPTERIQIKVSPDAAIPDSSEAGIVSHLRVSQSGTVVHMEVSVEIHHSYIGDLKVTLMSPTGIRTELHNRTGKKTQNLIKTYSDIETSSLVKMVGQEIHGDWRLWVADIADGDLGVLRHWSLTFDI